MLTTNLRKYRPALGTLASALLAVSAFPPLELHHLIWIALIPWIDSVQKCASAKEAAIQGLWLNFAIGLGSTFWIAWGRRLGEKSSSTGSH